MSVFEDPVEQLRRKSFDDKAVQTEKQRQQRLSEGGEDLDPEVFELMVQGTRDMIYTMLHKVL